MPIKVRLEFDNSAELVVLDKFGQRQEVGIPSPIWIKVRYIGPEMWRNIL